MKFPGLWRRVGPSEEGPRVTDIASGDCDPALLFGVPPTPPGSRSRRWFSKCRRRTTGETSGRVPPQAPEAEEHTDHKPHGRASRVRSTWGQVTTDIVGVVAPLRTGVSTHGTNPVCRRKYRTHVSLLTTKDRVDLRPPGTAEI